MKKMEGIVYCLFISAVIQAQTQDCDVNTIMAIKGKWVSAPNNVVYPEKSFPSGQYNQLYTRLDKIAGFFQEACPSPAGIEATWYRSVRGSSLVKNGPVPYQFNSLYQGWYCNKNLHKMMLGSETGTWSFVYVNDFGWFMTDQNDKASLTISGADAWMLPRKTGEWQGVTLYESSASRNNHVILITHKNQLPYKPVSRYLFLQALKQKIETDRKMQLDVNQKTNVRTAAEEEAAKQRALDNIAKTNRPDKVEQRKADYLKNYKSDAQLKEENIQRSLKYFDDRLKPVDAELNNEKKEDLQLPAIIDNNYISNFKGFTTEEKGGRMMVQGICHR